MAVTEEDEHIIVFNFTWRIEDFSLCLQEKKRTIDSPVFRIKQFQDSEWKLILYLPGDDEDNITLNLCRCRNGQDESSKIDTCVKLFIAKNDGSHVFLLKLNYFFHPTFHKYNDPLTISLKTVLEDPNTFLLKDTLTVGFQFLKSFEASLSDASVECEARSKPSLASTKYSIFLPLKFSKMCSTHEYPITSDTASTSMEHPEFQLKLLYDSITSENPVVITICMMQSNFKGILLCKLTFLRNEIIKYSYHTNYTFEAGLNHWTVPISEEIFTKNSLSDANSLKCELVVSTRKFVSSLENTIYKQGKPEVAISNSFDVSYLQNSLMEMYDKDILCDFKVIVSGWEFLSHKTVLAAVSPVFRAMLESGMTETGKSEVTIEEFSVKAVEKMLEFIYSERVKDPISWDVTLELYSIADKYQIKKLKAVCLSILESGLVVETVPDLLILADLHKDAHLYKVCESFIYCNSKAVFGSEAWKNLMKNNVQVASEYMFRFCQVYSQIGINPLQ